MGRFEVLGEALDLLFGKILNRNFNKADELIQKTEQELSAHKSSTQAHDATAIKYDGKVVGAGNTKQAIDNVQEQVNTLVLNGDSSVAAKQAAIDANGHDYQNLKLRLDTEHTQISEQLAEKAYQMTKFTEQGVAFDTSDPHVSWTHCNVSYDSRDDSFFVVYNGQVNHSITSSKVYARKKPRNGNFSGAITIANRLGEGISAKCQSSGIAPNGDYLAIVAHIDPNDWMNILGTYVYRSPDKGWTWDSGTKIGVNGVPVIGYSGDISGFLTLSFGRILLWGWDINKKSFAVYSDDNGFNWHSATIKGNPYNVTEPTFIELDDGTIVGYARDDVTDGSDHINAPKAAWFLTSPDGGVTWEVPVKSKVITDMSNNNWAPIKHGNIIEGIIGSRFLQPDGYGSIYQAVTTQEMIKNDEWFQIVRIARVNGIPASMSGDGDSGYYGAATAKDGTTLVFYYNGTKTRSNIYYLKGNFNANVYNDKLKDQYNGVKNPAAGELDLGDYSGTKGYVKLKRLVDDKKLFVDYAVASTGDAWLTLGKNENGVDTIINKIVLKQNGDTEVDLVNIATRLKVPMYTNATRPQNPIDGALILNSTKNRLEWFYGGLWSERMGKFVEPPITATTNGFKGDFSADANYIYVCYDTNKWIRVAKTPW